MHYSKLLGASSGYLTEAELDKLGRHKRDEDQIFQDILTTLQINTNNYETPSKVAHRLSKTKPFIETVFKDGASDPTELLAQRMDRCLLSALCSCLPEGTHVLETGTCSGMTTAFIAEGLSRTRRNLVFSVDLPTSEIVTQIHHIPYAEVGKDVPERLRNRVVYITEDAKSALPRILLEHNVGLFVHDSLHTQTHQLYEYVTSRALMPVNSILVSDDILWNSAFLYFVEAFDLPYWVCASNPNYGFALNRPHITDSGYIWGRIKTDTYLSSLIRE